MIGENAEWDEFISAHRWAVLTTLGSRGQPSSSVVAYARDGDQLVISTPGRTYKTLCVQRDPRVNLCIISNAEPFNFVAVEADAAIARTDLVVDTQRVFANIRGTGFEQPEDLPAWLEAQRRVILKLTPKRVYAVIR